MSGPRRHLRALLALTGVAAFTVGGLSTSGANFVAHTSSPSSFSTAAEFPVPALTITVPDEGATVGPAPAISGAGAAGAAITLDVHAGPTAAGAPVRTLAATRDGVAWSVVVTPALESGTYTARARRPIDAGAVQLSNARTLVVDATAPRVTITKPREGRRLETATTRIRGRAGNAPGDAMTVTIALYRGAAAQGEPVRTLTATRRRSRWRVTAVPALPDGQYTALATQEDAVGNAGTSAPRTFTVDTRDHHDPDDEEDDD